jgi:hypothetical protein
MKNEENSNKENRKDRKSALKKHAKKFHLTF